MAYGFKDLAKDLKRIADNSYKMMDDTIGSFTLIFGTELFARTPKRSGRAVFNWVTAIDGRPLTVLGKPSNRAIGQKSALLSLLTSVSKFNSRVNRTLIIANNLGYIYKLAYENWAYRPRTNPKAPPYWMIEANIADIDFSKYVDIHDNLFRGVK